MSDIFPNIPGRLVALESSDPRILTISLPGGTVDQQTMDIGIITQFSLAGQVAAQVQQALDSSVYVVAFGDRPGQLTFNTLLNPRYLPSRSTPVPRSLHYPPADTGGSGGCAAQVSTSTALHSFIEYYNHYKLRPGGDLSPLTISIGTIAVQGFISGFATSGQAQAAQIYSGQLSIVTVGIR